MANCPPTNVKFQFRRSTKAQWDGPTGSLTVLRDGEPGFEADTGQLKIGYTGMPWKDLPYVGEGDISRNIGLNAYINTATSNVTYDAANTRIIAATTLYGNSSYYGIKYTLSPSVTPATDAYLVNNASFIYNNLAPDAAALSTRGHNIQTQVMPLTTVVVGNNTLQIDITTKNAGGIGRGSTYSLTVPIYVTFPDPMGNPTITISPPSAPTIPTDHLVQISGVQYYAYGTTITFPYESIGFTNIYNIVPFQTSLPNNFLSITNTSGSGSPSSQNTTLIHYNPGAIPFAYSNTPLSTYYNSTFTYTFQGGAYSYPVTVGLIATNTKLLTGGTTYTGGPGYSNIGYIGNNWNPSYETNIPSNLNGSTISGLSSITRVSIPSSESTPTTPAVFQTFNPSNMSIYDPIYVPYNSTFYALNSNAASYLASTRIPSPVPINTTPIRFLSLELQNTAVLQSFTLKIGRTSSIPTIQNVYVKWYESARNITYGWYNANVPYGNTGGCQNGVANSFTYQIKINTADISNYSLASGAGGGRIWINIQFSGIILLNDICVL
jgi:hypothetical protein